MEIINSETFNIFSTFLEVRKPAQELYALINYGEMRRKLQFVTDKHFMKLKNLVYHGHVTVRCKGKNIRIKTPSCKALRRLNQLDGKIFSSHKRHIFSALAIYLMRIL